MDKTDWMLVFGLALCGAVVAASFIFNMNNETRIKEACQAACDPYRVVTCTREVAVCAGANDTVRAVELESKK
jgi:hypothetical protein